MQDFIKRTIIIKAPIGKVWHAISDYEEFGTWFRAKVHTPFKPGAVVACNSLYPGHEHLSWEMTITEMVPLDRISFTWPAFYGDDIERDAAQDPHLTATFSLEAIGNETRLTLTETGFEQLPPDYAPIAYRMNTGGWDEQMQNISAHVLT